MSTTDLCLNGSKSKLMGIHYVLVGKERVARLNHIYDVNRRLKSINAVMKESNEALAV